MLGLLYPEYSTAQKPFPTIADACNILAVKVIMYFVTRVCVNFIVLRDIQLLDILLVNVRQV